jgi:hypothetical protein
MTNFLRFETTWIRDDDKIETFYTQLDLLLYFNFLQRVVPFRSFGRIQRKNLLLRSSLPFCTKLLEIAM